MFQMNTRDIGENAVNWFENIEIKTPMLIIKFYR